MDGENAYFESRLIAVDSHRAEFDGLSFSQA